MPQYASIVQRTYVKGLDASTDQFDQPKGTLPRVSNMLYTVRGALRTMFGAAIIASFNGVVPVVSPLAQAIKRILLTLDNTNSNLRQLFFLQNAFAPLTSNYNFTGTPTTGGTIAPATLTYKIAMTDATAVFNGQPVGHVGLPTTIAVVVAGPNNAVDLSWNALPGPASYVITVQIGGVDKFLALVPNVAMQQVSGSPVSAPVIHYIDLTGAPVGPAHTVTFGANDTMDIVVLRHTLSSVNGVYGGGGDAYFPKGPADKTLPPIGGGTSSGDESDFAFSACGGVVGWTEAVPDMLEFANQLILLLGNGYSPYFVILTPISANPVTNSYTAQYPEWGAGETHLVGDNVIPTTPNGFFFTAIQGGLSDSVTEPTWPTTVGQTVVDKQVIWKCAGLVTGSPAPRGAAHGIYYAGSFWVFNTNPDNTSDGIDGPSSLRMSDIGAFGSWNPVNQAFIGKDDGSEGMGMASFTIAETGIPPTGSLVLFKNFSTYQVLGVFGAPDLAIQQIQSDMGNIAPRSIQFVSGYGIIRLSHLGFALFNGVRDNLISEEIRPYLFGSNPLQTGNLPSVDWTYAYLSQATQVTSPPMYICAIPIGDSNGTLRRLVCYDMVLRAWTILDFPSNINPDLYIRCLYQIRSPGSQPITIAGSGIDGTIFRLFYGDETWTDLVTPIAWAFTTPEVFNSQSPQGRLYVRKIILRGKYRGTATPTLNPISIGIVLDGSDATGDKGDDTSITINNLFYQLTGSASGFVIEADINEKCSNIHALISGTGQVEIDSVEWMIKPETTTVPPRIT